MDNFKANVACSNFSVEGQNQTTTDEGKNVTQQNGTTPEPAFSMTSTKLSTVITEEPTHEVTDTKPLSTLLSTTSDLQPTGWSDSLKLTELNLSRIRLCF